LLLVRFRETGPHFRHLSFSIFTIASISLARTSFPPALARPAGEEEPRREQFEGRESHTERNTFGVCANYSSAKGDGNGLAVSSDRCAVTEQPVSAVPIDPLIPGFFFFFFLFSYFSPTGRKHSELTKSGAVSFFSPESPSRPPSCLICKTEICVVTPAFFPWNRRRPEISIACHPAE
jgi:hypothetical protein